LFSNTRKPGYHHIASVDLHDPQIRRSFFNLMNVAKGSDAADHSGPVF
jgi:phosphoribosylpyrophosphate synthetase